MKDILDRASAGNYGVAAPNVATELDARACMEAAEELNAPIIIDLHYTMNPDIVTLGHLITSLAHQCRVPVALNLDHGGDMVQFIKAFRGQFTSVMVDRSVLPYEENVAQVKQIVEMAHSIDVSVEAELGHVGQGDNYAVDGNAALTDPQEAARFIKDTGIDCLAVAIGTAHGAYTGIPKLHFDRLKEIKEATGNFPLVLHGGSGSGDENLQKACTMGINKVNICNDLLKQASIDVQAADLTGNHAYDIWDVVKNGYKKALKKYIELFGGKDKAWFEAPKGLTRAAIIGREK
ncbi:class II fructose-bisphosphate aldolase [Anaerolentibacter hominis]|uniref:class II fructose-bisphosphate aldolase n=1 Tax=Anaerolentibacter hominis TaxID=3079009 RepID=UPI0031B80ADD